jgi:hypothetical protein
MGLQTKQSKFLQMTNLLMAYAHMLGYELTYGDAKRPEDCPYGRADSLHKKRLALDLNLFKDGEYLSSTEDHQVLGEFWEHIGGSWGGRFNDGNHYSLEHEGMR